MLKVKLAEICLDMDGTIADLYNVPDWLESLESKSVEPFLKAKPLVDTQRMNYLLGELKKYGANVHVITWLPKKRHGISAHEYDSAVEDAKRQWLKKYRVPYDKFTALDYGMPKHTQIDLKEGERKVLFDDNAKIRAAWDRGRAIDPAKYDINAELFKMLKYIRENH